MKAETIKKEIPRWLFPAVILVLVFVVYGNSIKNNYSLDDDFVTSTFTHPNARIEKGIHGIPEIFRSRYVETGKQSYSYRPLVLVTFALEYEFFKVNPHIGHFINVILYAVICLLIFFVLGNLFASYHKLLPGVITLVFICHPIHTEVVDSLKNRDELLSFLFGLLALLGVLRYMDTKRIWLVITSVFFLWLATLSKETAMIFFTVIPLSVYFFKSDKSSSLFGSVIGIFIALVVFALIKKFLLHGAPVARDFVFTENPLFYDRSIGTRFPAALYILWFYLKLMLIPFPLSAYYGYNTIPIASWGEPMVWVSLVIHSIMGVYVIMNVKKKKILAFAFLFYLLEVLPYSDLVKPAAGIVAERFVLAASLGFCIVSVLLIFSLFKMTLENKSSLAVKIPVPFIILVSFIVVLFSGLTIKRNADWKDIETLFKRDLRYFDDSYNLHYILANSLATKVFRTPEGTERKRLIAEAQVHYRKITGIVESGISKYPSDYISRNNLGTIYVNYLNRPDLARPLFEQSIAIKPGFAETYYDLGFCFEKLNKPDSAILLYEKTISMDSLFQEPYKHINALYLQKGSYNKAVEVSTKATRSFPGNAEFFVNLGNARLLAKDTASGIKALENALRAEPSNTNLRDQILGFFKTIGYAGNSELKK